MRNLLLAAVTILLGSVALAQASTSAIGEEAKASDQAKDKAETAAAAETKEPRKLELPAGFKVKRRGEITLYCMKGKATGTRFQTESCYDEAQLRDYLLAREQNNRDFDRTRAICSNPGVCAPQ